MAGAAGMTPLRLQPDFQRLKQEVDVLKRRYFADASKESEQALDAKSEEYYAYIRAHKERIANDSDRPD
jgi:hypothetical protein